MLLVPPYEVYFRGVYVSVWFDEKINIFARAKYIDDLGVQKYYIPLVFSRYMSLDDIVKYVKRNILDRYDVELARWRKSIHVKYFYQVIKNGECKTLNSDPYNVFFDCVNLDRKYIEVWVEYNYDSERDEWDCVCDWCRGDCLSWCEDSNVYEIHRGLDLYKYVPFRLVGSLYTFDFIVLVSSYKYQYLLKYWVARLAGNEKYG